MFENLKGKKLLILGGGALICQIVEAARAMGIYTIVADYHSDFSLSPAKRIADEHWEISWNDIDGLEKRCRSGGVNGVFTGFSEFRVLAARRLSDRMGYPFYATMEQIEVTRNKALFKEACRSNAVAVVEQYQLSAEPSKEERMSLVYPVVLKPADNAGSRGISVCYDETELKAGIEKALSFSAAGEIVAERYMECPEVNVTYTIQDGEISLSCMSDAQAGAQKHGQIKLTDGWLFPSRYLECFTESCDKKLRGLLRALGMQNGVAFITGFFDEPEFRIFEMGFRLGGGTTYNFISRNNGIDYLKMMIAHSLTGEMMGWNAAEADDAFFKKPCCNLTVMARPGTVGSVGDVNHLRQMEGVLSVDLFYEAGQEIPDSGALNQTFARVNIIADSAELLAERIQRTYEILDVKDSQGQDMLLSRLKGETVAAYWEKL